MMPLVAGSCNWLVIEKMSEAPLGNGSGLEAKRTTHGNNSAPAAGPSHPI